MLGRQSVIDIENHHFPIKSVDKSFAVIMVGVEPAKHPSAAVEIDIGCSF